MRILLVEDEDILSGIIAKGLRASGYAVDAAFDGEEALRQYEINDYDLIILDLNLPLMDGMEVLRTIRSGDSDTKILILSARVTVEDRVAGLDAGASDYLIKPFDFDELEARVRNLLRRQFTQLPTVLTVDDFKIDLQAKRVELNGVPMAFPRKEYSIFTFLAMHKNQVVSAEQLIEHIWDNDFDPFSNVLRYHICSLKKKLAAAGKKEIIKTVRGQGYMLVEGENNETISET